MAFGLSDRFPSPPPYKRIFDPGAYQKVSGPITQINKVPFLSKAPRTTQPGNKLWTHAIYNTDIKAKILNCTALKSKVPRFPYEAMTEEEFEKLLCQCGIQSTCECSTSEHDDEEIVCQGKIYRRLFKGPAPRVMLDVEEGFNTNKDTDTQPPFYNARVNESTAYYQGCKWSQWTSKRSSNFMVSGPGPADYTIENEPTYETICAEKVRAHKRKTSKQLRYIEMVQRRNIREQLPGPGSYSPKEPKGTDLNYLGPKAERFITSKYDERPGPADYWVKRDFQPPEFPDRVCQAKLPDPAPFGSKAVRLKPKREEGPSPASYNYKTISCKFMKCSKVPFGTSSVRFKLSEDDQGEGDEYDDDGIANGDTQSKSEPEKENCLLPTWEFRSNTIRMKPLLKKLYEPSPADLPQRNYKIMRSFQLQSAAPFFTSDERFRPWYNWIPVHGAGNTPGPCYYSLEKPKCFPAVHRGPLSRSPRFKLIISQTPCPNEYKVGGGIETILSTHNERLKSNMEKQHKFIWKPKNKGNIILSPAERENVILTKSIELLNVMK
ncbi:uncharacterized protein [Epargyreus clarus]|uniref:uncharacterized protein n=1 Tax=Epargyreus clarus TaxID=520877 RepID=UPI003C2EC458